MVYSVSQTIDALDLATDPYYHNMWYSHQMRWHRKPPSDDEGTRIEEVIRKSLPKSYRPPRENNKTPTDKKEKV